MDSCISVADFTKYVLDILLGDIVLTDHGDVCMCHLGFGVDDVACL